MAHPYAKQSDAFKGKAAARIGKAGGGEVRPIKINPSTMAPVGSIEGKGISTYRRELGRGESGKFGINPYASSGQGADKYARGGRAKKAGKVNVNIIVPGAGGAASPPTHMPPLPGPGAGAGLAPPGVPMPPPMKSGGRVAKARGGKLTGGADTGVGRIQETARLKAARGGK